MSKTIFLILIGIGSIWAQSSLDIMNSPTDARAAAMGINLSPIVKPARILTHPQHQVDLSVWNWVADIQGGTIGVGFDRVYISFQALNSGDIELRDDVPSTDPLSTFQYALFNTGAAYAQAFGSLSVGLGAEFVYERTLNASAGGLSLNFSTAYPVSKTLLLSGGLRHVGFTQALEDESTSLPSELWFEMDLGLNMLTLSSELNTGKIPFSIGAAYPLLGSFELLAGLQIEPADPDLKLHPSAGFSAVWDNFILGYSIYQFEHSLGPRHFVSLYWNY